MSYFNTINVQDSNNITVNPATTDKQDVGNTSLNNIDGKVATSAKQDTANASLSSINTKQTDGSQKAQMVNSTGQVADITTDGKLRVDMTVGVPRANQSIQLLAEETSAAVYALEWQDLLQYTIPTGYDMSCICFQGNTTQNMDLIRAVNRSAMGSYNINTQVFVDGGAWTLPQFASRVSVYVTTLFVATNEVVVTITYTNEKGVTGRTGTVTLLKGSKVGTRKEITLQSGDCGVTDITNVSTPVSYTAGAFVLEGNITLTYLLLESANVGYNLIFSGNAVYINEGQTIFLQYQSTVNNVKTRRASLIGTLIPRT